MISTLASKTDRSLQQCRWSKTSDGWGGDEDVSLTLLAEPIARVEWVEGVGNRWTLWIFDTDADIQPDDIFLVPGQGLALMVERVNLNTALNGSFHHWEVRTTEHEMSVVALQALIP